MSDTTLDITLRLKDINHLFQPSAISPLSEEHYSFGSKPGIEHVLGEVYAHPRTRQIRLSMTLPADQMTPGIEDSVQAAIHRYADARLVDAGQQLSKTRHQATQALPLAVLGLVLIAGSVPLMDPSLSYLVQLAGNGLSVAGWVAVWYPLDSLIFQVWIQRQDDRALRTLRDATVLVRPE